MTLKPTELNDETRRADMVAAARLAFASARQVLADAVERLRHGDDIRAADEVAKDMRLVVAALTQALALEGKHDATQDDRAGGLDLARAREEIACRLACLAGVVED